MSFEASLRRQRPAQKVLSIQSHVVSGYVGNRCAVFPLNLHGFDADVINSVQFSNHTGHKNGIRGQRLNSNDLNQLFEGLELNSLADYSHILTGYCADVSFLREIVAIVKKLKIKNPSLLYYCDPVLGDNGYYYAPAELMPIYREEVLPLADVITPNAFELSEITGLPCQTIEQCILAIKTAHNKYGTRFIVVTSGIEEAFGQWLYCIAASFIGPKPIIYRFDIPRIHGNFVGTGDLFASLLLIWLNEFESDLQKSVTNVILSLQCVLKRTSAKAYGNPVNKDYKPTFKERELCLIDSRADLLIPSGTLKIQQIE